MFVFAAYIENMTNDKRVAAGSPAGGEFAPHDRAEGAPLSAEVGFGYQTPDASGALTPEQIAMNAYMDISSYPWPVSGPTMRDLLARGARAGIEYEHARASTAGGRSRLGERIADEYGLQAYAAAHGVVGGDVDATDQGLEEVRRVITEAVYEAQATPDFKADSESDDWRDDWDRFKHSAAPTISITAEDGEYTDFTISSDNLRRFLAMLSTESAE